MHWFLNMAEGIPKVEFCLFILRSICHPHLFFVKRGYEIKANTTMVVSKERRKRLKTKKKKNHLNNKAFQPHRLRVSQKLDPSKLFFVSR